ncbi:hypothetical protein GEMRC1_013131 [Eukaryota sp. GEM-RC1]
MDDYNITNASLKRFNTIMGFLHLLQGILMLCFALFIERIAAFKIPIWSYFLTFDKVQQRLITDPKLLWEVPFGIAVSLFLLMSAIAHFIIVSPWGNRIYNQDLNRRMNRFRWTFHQKASDIDRLFRSSGLSDSDGLIPCNELLTLKYDYSLPTITKSERDPLRDVTNFASRFYAQFSFLKNVSMDNLLIASGAVQKVISGQSMSYGYYSSYQNDIDFFIYGINSTDQATARVNQFINELNQLNHYYFSEMYVLRGSHCITLKPTDDRRYSSLAECQIILRLYSSKSEILHGFDLGSSQVGFDGKQLYTTTLGKLSYTYMINVVDPSRRSTSYEYRLGKYLERGFKIVLPNLDVKKLREEIRGDAVFDVVPYLRLGMGHKEFDGNKIVTDFVLRATPVCSDYVLEVRPASPVTVEDVTSSDPYNHITSLLAQNIQSLATGKMVFSSVEVLAGKEEVDVCSVPFFWGLDGAPNFEDISKFYKKLKLVSNTGDLYVSSLRKFLIVDLVEVVEFFYSPGIPFARKLNYLENLKEKQVSKVVKFVQQHIVDSKTLTFITENPGTQLTSSINPIIEDPITYYGDYTFEPMDQF